MTESKGKEKEVRLWLKYMPESNRIYGGTATYKNKYRTPRDRKNQIVCLKRLIRKHEENLWMARIYDHDNTILYSQKFNQDVDR